MRRRTALPVIAVVGAAVVAGAGVWSAARGSDGPPPVAARSAPAVHGAASAAAGQAAPVGFGQPRTLVTAAGRSSGASLERVALAPSGRLAVLLRTADFERDRYAYRVMLGAGLTGLAAPATVRAGRRSARDGGEPQLVAFRDGAFAACFVSDPRRGDAVASCSFAPPTGGFGPERVIARVPWQRRLSLTVAPRPDGRLAVVFSQLDGNRRLLRSLLLSADGTATPPVQVLKEPRDASSSLAPLDDGTLALATAVVPSGALGGRGELRVMAADADRFGPPTAFTDDELASASVTGGRGLSISYTPGADGRERDSRVVVRRPDGSFAPPQSVPRPGPGFLGGSASTLPDGSSLAVVQAQDYTETDCGNLKSAIVGAGPLVPARPFENGTSESDSRGREPVTAERLSAARQFGVYPQLGSLDDGTNLIVWGNSANAEEHLRLEAAFRAPGTDRFGPRRQVLPELSTGFTFFLAAAGDRAVLVWGAGKPKLEDLLPRRIVGAELRRGGPFAAPAGRPKEPVSPCS